MAFWSLFQISKSILPPIEVNHINYVFINIYLVLCNTGMFSYTYIVHEAYFLLLLSYQSHLFTWTVLILLSCHINIYHQFISKIQIHCGRFRTEDIFKYQYKIQVFISYCLLSELEIETKDIQSCSNVRRSLSFPDIFLSDP